MNLLNKSKTITCNPYTSVLNKFHALVYLSIFFLSKTYFSCTFVFFKPEIFEQSSKHQYHPYAV